MEIGGRQCACLQSLRTWSRNRGPWTKHRLIVLAHHWIADLCLHHRHMGTGMTQNGHDGMKLGSFFRQLFSQCLDLLNDHGGGLVQRHDTFPFCLTCRQMKPGSSIGIAIQALQRQPSNLLTPGSAPAGG